MFAKSLFLALAIVAASATAIAATTYQTVIYMVWGGFFPETTYLQQGETVVFYNLSGEGRTVIGENEAWSSGHIDNGSWQYVTIFDASEYSTMGSQGEIKGYFSFDFPILGPLKN